MSKTATTRPKTSSRSASKAAGSAAGSKKKSTIRVKAVGSLSGDPTRIERMVTLRDGAQVVTSNRLRAFAGGGGLDTFLGNAGRFRGSPLFATDADRFVLGSVPLTAVVKPSSNRRSTQKANEVAVAPDPALIGDVSLHIATFVVSLMPRNTHRGSLSPMSTRRHALWDRVFTDFRCDRQRRKVQYPRPLGNPCAVPPVRRNSVIWVQDGSGVRSRHTQGRRKD